MTTCLAESVYLFERALKTRGYLFQRDRHTFNVTLANGGKFSLSFFEGNRRMMISHGVYLPESERGKGIGKKLLQLREQIASEAGVNLLMATVRNDNPIEIHLLENAQWERLWNRQETGVSLWIKKL